MNMKGSEMKIKGLERKHDENEMSKNRTHNNVSLRLGNNSGRSSTTWIHNGAEKHGNTKF